MDNALYTLLDFRNCGCSTEKTGGEDREAKDGYWAVMPYKKKKIMFINRSKQLQKEP